MYLMNPSIDDMAPPTIIPASTSMMPDSLLSILGMRIVTATAAIPPANAVIWIMTEDTDRSIAIAAPTQAPPDTPRKSGETSGFLKIPWYTAPDKANAAPTMTAAITRGSLTPISMFSSIPSHDGSEPVNLPARIFRHSPGDI